MSSVDYSNWKVADLKAELKAKVIKIFSYKSCDFYGDAIVPFQWVFT